MRSPLTRTRLIAHVLALLAVLAAACSCSSAAGFPAHPPTPSAPTVGPAPATGGPGAYPVGSSAQTITVGPTVRTFHVYRPASLTLPAPLVVMLHGALGTGSQAEASYGWDAQADTGHFVVAYPDGLNRTWAASADCCGPPAARHVDDVAFITSMIRTISSALAIDQRRIYATGISNGGMLAYRLACDSTIFAAIGPDSATLLADCPKPAPVSVIHIHGTADHTVPYAGGPGRRDNGGTGPQPADTAGPPIPQLVARWRATDHCAAPAQSGTDTIAISLARCPDGRAVELVTLSGAGHQWPGQPGPQGPMAARLGLDRPFAGLDATATIWQFFQAHPKAG